MLKKCLLPKHEQGRILDLIYSAGGGWWMEMIWEEMDGKGVEQIDVGWQWRLLTFHQVPGLFCGICNLSLKKMADLIS